MKRITGVVLLLAVCVCPVPAQQAEGEADLDRVAAEGQINQRVQYFMDMGLEREVALWVTMLEQSGMEPGEILMTLIMIEEGPEGAGMMMLMDALKGSSSARPVVLEHGEQVLLIVDGGVLYNINLQTMEVTGKVAYSGPAQSERDAVWSLLIPLMTEWGGEYEVPGGPEAQRCLHNLDVLGGAFSAYVDDNNGTLPGENWVEAITPYLEDLNVLSCPSRPDQAVGYAMNAKMVDVQIAEIAEPGERILLFDTTMQAASPVGGPEAVPEGIVHEDGLNVLFADGRVEWLEMAEVREVLGFPIGE